MSEQEDTAKRKMINALCTALAREAQMPTKIARIKARLKKLGHKLTRSEKLLGAATTGVPG